MVERISTGRRILYALGSPGWQFSNQIVISIAIYYYLPPGGSDLTAQVPVDPLWGAFTVFGLAMLAGRLFDTLADPPVGHLSDRSRSRLGRRRSLMIYGVGPMVLFPALLFWPPAGPGSLANGLSLALLLVGYFIAFTVYVAPYLALFPEITTDNQDRAQLSRLIAMLSFPVIVLFGTGWAKGVDLARDAGLSSEDSVRLIVVLATVLGFGLCLLPIFAVDEKRHCRAAPSEIPFLKALQITASCRPFLIYLAGQILFIFGTHLMLPSPVYFATVALGRDEGFTMYLSGGLGISVVAGFFLIVRLIESFGAKRTLIGCNLLFALGLGVLGFLRPDVPGGPHDRMNLILVMGAFMTLGLPAVAFLVLPNILISQIIDYDSARTGSHRAAMFFGVQGLFTKWVYGLSGFTLAYLLSEFGNSPEEPLGILLIGPVAAAACLIAGFILCFYPEKEILAAANEKVSESSVPEPHP